MSSPSSIVTSARNLVLRDGLWVSHSIANVSYPEDGNQDSFDVEDNSFWFQHRNRIIMSVARSHRLSGELLDVGGGNGYVARGFQEAGIFATVIEPGMVGAKNARDRGLVAICSTVEDAGFAPASLPAVGMFDVLEHIEDDLGFLRMIRSLIQPNGHLLLTVPTYQILWSAEDRYAGHFRRYTRRSLTETCRRANFEVQFFSYFFSCLVPAVFLFRTLPSWMGLRAAIGNPDTARREHCSQRPMGQIIEIWLRQEARRISANRSMPCGSSCIVLARPT